MGWLIAGGLSSGGGDDEGTDVKYLADKNIIENYFGTEAEIARFINNLGKDMSFDINRCYLAKLFNDVNKYYQDPWVALVLLVLSVMQTLYTLIPFYKNS
ncbi:hypothetical protein Droror1_Dr00009097 [Drosera rotundifolia]